MMKPSSDRPNDSNNSGAPPAVSLVRRAFSVVKVAVPVAAAIILLLIAMAHWRRLMFWAVVTSPATAVLVLLLHPKVPRTAKFKLVAALMGLSLALLLGEASARLYFATSGRHFEEVRLRLVRESAEAAPGQRFCVGQPYLLYVPGPGYRNRKNYHNEQGYRGKAVPMHRTPGLGRILCLGGSTTYSSGTLDAEASYPAQLERLLNEDPPAGFGACEVINGGLPYGTTAELLTHYHFKFHYFKPDCVVINTGGNDALAANREYYQPDYSHWRQQPPQVLPLSPFGQKVLRSRLLSMAAILLMYGHPAPVWSLDWIEGRPPTIWHEAARESGLVKSLPDEDLAFTHNLQTLIDLIHGDGARVVLVPFRIAPGGQREQAFEQCQRNERILKQIAADRDLPVAPFPQEIISPENWVDSCHLTAEGCSQKAEHIARYVRQALENARHAPD